MERKGLSSVPALLSVVLLPVATAFFLPSFHSPSPTQPPQESGAPQFLTPNTVVEVGATRLIPFRVVAAAEDREFAHASADESLLIVSRLPSALAGSDIGFVRVRGVSPGRAQLTIADKAITVDVVPPRAPADERRRPEVTEPAPGAAVWGKLAVGVEWLDESSGGSGTCTLRVGAQTFSPVSLSPTEQGPTRRAVFEIDTGAALSPGLEFVPVVKDGAGHELSGPSVSVRVLHPAPADITAREAEDTAEVPRPERVAKSKVSIGRDPYASGGVYVSNNGGEGPVCFPIDVPSPGFYQVMFTAGSDFGGGALPTVGIYVDEQKQPITNGRVVDEKWRRVAIGVPIRLDAGPHVLTLQYLNDFYAARLDDRNLRIDFVEAARIGDAGDGVSQAGGEAMAAMPAPAMDAMMGAPAGAGAGIDRLGLLDLPLRIAFNPPLRDTRLTGETEISAQCAWSNSEAAPAPAVTLRVNDRTVGTQRSGAPKFVLDTSWLKHGANSLRFEAAGADGSSASTPTVTMFWPGADGDGAQAPGYHRFTVHEPGWDDVAKGLLTRSREMPEQRAIGFGSQGTATLDLPPTLVGDFDVFLEARGDQFNGPPIAALSLDSGGNTTPIGEVKVATTRWATLRVGRVTLAEGANRLSVTFTNDAYEEGKGDRNLSVQAVVFRSAPARPSPADQPHAVIRYPATGDTVAMQDAVVAEAWSTGALESAELLFDGRQTGLKPESPRRPGPIVLPLLLRGVPPGEHTIAVRATDAAGTSADSDTVKIRVRETSTGSEAQPPPTRYQRAVWLLDRLAFGPEPDELADLLTLGEEKWLADRLSRPCDDAEDTAAFESAVVRYTNRRGEGDVQQRALAHALFSPNPVRTRFVLWAENHFSTWIRKDEAPLKCDEHAAFWRLGVSPFPDLLLASATSPAMLRYLDQDRSYAGKLNENYAREIMELHTLGVHGGYSQADVTNLASVLTGLTLARQGDGHSPGEIQTYDVRFDPLLSESRGTVVFGLKLPSAAPAQRFDRARLALEMLASHPSTAMFIATKLADHYVGTPAPDRLVKDLARVFMETHGDMRAMLTALVANPEFWQAAQRLSHPLDYAVRLGRVVRQARPGQVHQYLQRSRFGLFDRPTPDGYPEVDSDYADSNAMMQRWRFARDQAAPLASLVPGPWRAEPPKNGPADPAWDQRVIDCLAVRMTGRLLGDASNTAALELLAASKGSREDRVREIGAFIAQTPEANLR